MKTNRPTNSGSLKAVRLLTMASLLAAIAAQPARGETLTSAVRKSLANHPRAAAAKWNAESVKEDALVVRSRRLPHIGILGSIGADYRDRDIVGIESGEWLAAREARAVLTQRLFDGGLTLNEQKAAEARSESASLLRGQTDEELAMDVVEAYLGVLRLREQLDLAEANVGNHRQTVSHIRQRFDAGKGQISDVSLVEGRLALAESSRENRETLLENFNIRYHELVGVRPVSLEAPSPAPGGRLPGDFYEVNARGNFAVQAAERNYDAAKYEELAGKGLSWPRLDLELSGAVGEDIGGIEGSDDEVRALLLGTWDLYAGGGIRAQKKAREARAKRALGLAGDAVLLAEEDLARAMADRQGAREQISDLRHYADSMRDVVAGYQQQFEIGTRSILSVLDVQNEEFRASSALVDARFAEQLSGFRMLAANGILVDTLLGGGRNPFGSDVVEGPHEGPQLFQPQEPEKSKRGLLGQKKEYVPPDWGDQEPPKEKRRFFVWRKKSDPGWVESGEDVPVVEPWTAGEAAPSEPWFDSFASPAGPDESGAGKPVLTYEDWVREQGGGN